MEESYGKSWVVSISILINGIMLAINIYFAVFNKLELYVGLCAGYMITFPSILRFIICYNWRAVECDIKKSKDISQPYITWRGVSIVYAHEADIEYSISGKTFNSKLVSTLPFDKKTKTIFYNPTDPSAFVQNKGLGHSGIICLVLILLNIYLLFHR
jgi:hypothetical protein